MNDIHRGLMNSLFLNVTDKRKDIIINYLNTNFQITSSYNQEYNESNNISTLHLGYCETILKEKYNIDKNDNLIILKLEHFIEGITIPILTYEVFNPINNEKLDLKYCDKEKINYKIPVSINEEEMFLHDPNNAYYNDICYTSGLHSGNDITLYDRKNEYNNNNYSLCEKNCNFEGYNSNTKKVLCSCPINNKSPLILEDIIDQEQLLNNFVNIKSISNIGVMKCYNLLFSKKGITNNLGSYILLIIIFINIISVICFVIKGYKSIYNKISDIIIIKKENEKENNIVTEGNNENFLKINKNNKIKKEDILNNDKMLKGKIKYDEDINQKKSKDYLINLSQNTNKNESFERKMNIFPVKLDITTKLDDFEINSLSYEKAVEKDKTSFFQYYVSLLKTNHLLIFTFNPNSDYNSRIIKICLFFFYFP